MAFCGDCNKTITSKQLKLVCSDCDRDFHASCYKMSKADVECVTADGLLWRCKSCAVTRRRSLRFDSEAQDGKLTLEDIMEKIVEIADAQKSQEANFNKSNNQLNEKMDENIKTVQEQKSTLDKYLKRMEEVFEENRHLKKKVAELELKVDDLEQYSRLNAVEIHGIPQELNENVISVVRQVGKALDMEISESQIDACHRLGRRPGPRNQPPGIIVRFVRRLDKDEMMRKRRVKRNLSTRHMDLPMDVPVYVNEVLSPTRRRLLARAREIKREMDYKYLWVRGGKIFLRKEENAPVVQVTCQSDLDTIVNK